MFNKELKKRVGEIEDFIGTPQGPFSDIIKLLKPKDFTLVNFVLMQSKQIDSLESRIVALEDKLKEPEPNKEKEVPPAPKPKPAAKKVVINKEVKTETK